jgi:two-component system response regulator HydG
MSSGTTDFTTGFTSLLFASRFLNSAGGERAVLQGAFEAASGGTLFLDEVGELPLTLQAKLLRVLESGEVKPVGATRSFRVDVRVVAATNRNLLAESLRGRFRPDLYYRLSVMPLMLPPLRERRGDIRLLAEHFVRLFEPRGHEVKFTPAALQKLREHPWPGNVRELRNVVQRALLLRQSPMLDTPALTFEQPPDPAPGAPARASYKLPEGMTLQQLLGQVERECVEDALRNCDYQRGKAARRLGLSRTSLFERMKAWGSAMRASRRGRLPGHRGRRRQSNRNKAEAKPQVGPVALFTLLIQIYRLFTGQD